MILPKHELLPAIIDWWLYCRLPSRRYPLDNILHSLWNEIKNAVIIEGRLGLLCPLSHLTSIMTGISRGLRGQSPKHFKIYWKFCLLDISWTSHELALLIASFPNRSTKPYETNISTLCLERPNLVLQSKYLDSKNTWLPSKISIA